MGIEEFIKLYKTDPCRYHASALRKALKKDFGKWVLGTLCFRNIFIKLFFKRRVHRK